MITVPSRQKANHQKHDAFCHDKDISKRTKHHTRLPDHQKNVRDLDTVCTGAFCNEKAWRIFLINFCCIL